jgi:hypothetical protein
MKTSSRKNDIDALVVNIKSQYAKIESLYTSSLQKKEIDSSLKIDVKNYLENARSALDYCAHDVAEVLGISATKIYFPIVEGTVDINSFKGFIGRNLPGLESKNKKMFDYLESIQPYHENFSWLADFAEVNIDTKHSQLTPQTKTETERITSTHIGGGSVSWNPSGVQFGSGVFINGAQVNPHTQMPVSTPETTVTKEIWVDFRFNDKVSALPLLKKIHDEIPKIVNDIYLVL